MIMFLDYLFQNVHIVSVWCLIFLLIRIYLIICVCCCDDNKIQMARKPGKKGIIKTNAVKGCSMITFRWEQDKNGEEAREETEAKSGI